MLVDNTAPFLASEVEVDVIWRGRKLSPTTRPNPVRLVRAIHFILGEIPRRCLNIQPS